MNVVPVRVRELEANIDRCRLAEARAQQECRIARSRFAAAARMRLRDAQNATVAAERALTAALIEAQP